MKSIYEQVKDHEGFPKKIEKVNGYSDTWEAAYTQAQKEMINFLSSVGVDKKKAENILFKEMKPVLCEKTNKGEWILKDPSTLATTLCQENIIGDIKDEV